MKKPGVIVFTILVAIPFIVIGILTVYFAGIIP